jgi:hypothetical protein
MKVSSGLPKALLVSSAVVCVGAMGVASSYAAPSPAGALAVSRFKQDNEGWLVKGDPTSPTPRWISKGGDPGGYIETTDAALGGIMYWSAPAAFLGDKSAAYGGSLRYDLRQHSDGRPFDAADVILKGGAVRLTYDVVKAPKSSWTNFKVPLSETGWMDNGVPATKADMLEVLSSVTTLLIRAEYSSHTDVDDLDNPMIKPPKA